MNTRNYLYLLSNVLLGFFLQVTLIELQIWEIHVVFFPYLLPLFLLPMRSSTLLDMGVACVLGWAVDRLYGTISIHMMASVVVAFFRPWLIDLYTARSIEMAQVYARVCHMGWRWYIMYLLPLVWMHHTIVYVFEFGWDFLNWAHKLGESLLGTVVFFIFLEYFRYIFHRKRKGHHG